MRGGAVAEPAERELGAVGEHAGDVGEWAAEMCGDAGQRGPVAAAVVQQPEGDGVPGGLRDGGHVPHWAGGGRPGPLWSWLSGGHYICVIYLGDGLMQRMR